MKEYPTFIGTIQVIGTNRGFAVRLKDAKSGPDAEYNTSEVTSFTIQNEGQPKIVLEPTAVEDYQESSDLDA